MPKGQVSWVSCVCADSHWNERLGSSVAELRPVCRLAFRSGAARPSGFAIGGRREGFRLLRGARVLLLGSGCSAEAAPAAGPATTRPGRLRWRAGLLGGRALRGQLGDCC